MEKNVSMKEISELNPYNSIIHFYTLCANNFQLKDVP